jgi:hypothetical protein
MTHLDKHDLAVVQKLKNHHNEHPSRHHESEKLSGIYKTDDRGNKW